MVLQWFASARDVHNRFCRALLAHDVELAGKYVIKSNRESGLGRYDIRMLPLAEEYDGIIIEFKVRDERKEADLKETAHRALQQIEQKRYEEELIQTGIARERIYKYGFAFEGKTVYIES